MLLKEAFVEICNIAVIWYRQGYIFQCTVEPGLMDTWNICNMVRPTTTTTCLLHMDTYSLVGHECPTLHRQSVCTRDASHMTLYVRSACSSSVSACVPRWPLICPTFTLHCTLSGQRTYTANHVSLTKTCACYIYLRIIVACKKIWINKKLSIITEEQIYHCVHHAWLYQTIQILGDRHHFCQSSPICLSYLFFSWLALWAVQVSWRMNNRKIKQLLWKRY